jgi:monoamine oxidase
MQMLAPEADDGAGGPIQASLQAVAGPPKATAPRFLESAANFGQRLLWRSRFSSYPGTLPGTPLFRSVLRALRAGTLAAEGRPSEPPPPTPTTAPGFSRRTLLVGAASAAAATASCATGAHGRRRAATDPPVLVVGAGLAGLTAAYRLRRAGVPSRIIEADERTGGRIRTLRGFFPEGQHAELGAEFIDSRHGTVRGLVKELGLDLDDLTGADAASAPFIWHFGGVRRSDAAVVEAFRPLAPAINAAIASLPAGARGSEAAHPAALALDRLSLDEWLDRAGATGWMRELLTVAYVTEFGLDAGGQSALNFLLTIDPRVPPLRVYGDSDERFRVRGGNERLTSALGARLGGAVEHGTALEAVRQRADGALMAIARRQGTVVEIAATHVVLAVPFTTLRRVDLATPLPPAKRRAVAELGYGTNAKLLLGFYRRAWGDDPRAPSMTLTDRSMQCAWEASRRQQGEGAVITNFTGGSAGAALGGGAAGPSGPAAPAAGATRGLEADLEAIFPGATAARRVGAEALLHWPSHPWSRGSYACFAPGQWTAFGAAVGTPAGRLHFAGEHCSLESQGFMEGACETGERAARAIAADLRR